MFFVYILINAVVIIALAQVMKGIEVKNFKTSIIVSLALALLNALLRPILIILTLPITFLTLGIFVLLINGLMVWMAGHWIKGFSVKNFGSAFWFALILSIINGLLT